MGEDAAGLRGCQMPIVRGRTSNSVGQSPVIPIMIQIICCSIGMVGVTSQGGTPLSERRRNATK
jgi:hypothetical protein